MTYRVVEKITNISNINYNAWKEFEIACYTNKSIPEIIDLFLQAGKESGSPVDKLAELTNFISSANYSISWDPETQTGVRTIDWPDKETWDLFNTLKLEHWEDLVSEREILSAETV